MIDNVYLATANDNNPTNTISIYINNPVGTFTLGSNVASGTGPPRGIVAGDFDGDGDMDLAVTSYISNNVRIFLNNGNATFVQGSLITVGATAWHITSGDYDGDGDLDLAVANEGSTFISLLLNSGYATFTVSNITVVAGLRAICSGDFNNDGDVDIAVAGGTAPGNVYILANNGSGVFTPSAGILIGNTPYDIQAGDFDGDGDLDLATANGGTANVSILTNTAGVFTVTSSTPAGTLAHGLAVGDVDGDNDLDIAVANFSVNTASILFNQPISTVFYYRSGDAGNPANWFSTPNPTGGAPATSFSSPATDFYLMGGGATTTATVNTSFTLGANVSLHVTTPSVLAVANGISITNNGFLNISGATVAGATLRLVGTGTVVGNQVRYWSTNATLEYTGAVARATSNVEFPGPMPGSVIMNNTGGVTLHANRQINGTFTMQGGTLDISGRTLQPNGAIVFSGGTIIASATAALTITGAGNITGSALFTGALGALTMNRAAATLSLGSPLDISAAGTLTLTQGYVQTTPTNILRITNTAAGAIVGGGTASHVVGPLRWFLPAGGGTYNFPVGGGTATTYIPLSVNYASAGGTASYEVQPFLTGSGGTEAGVIGAGTLSTTEYWRTVLGGFALNNATLTLTRTAPALIGTNRIGEATTAGGTYQGINGNTLSMVVAPNIMNTTPYTSMAVGARFFAIGAAAAPPVVTALSPTQNNPAVTPLTSNVAVTFSQTLTALGMRTWNSFTGRNLIAPTFAGNVGTQTGMTTRPGERVMTTVTATGTASMAGFMTTPHVSSFTGRAGAGPATFTQTSLTPTPASVWGVKLGYFNNDTNLDVALSTGDAPTGSFRIYTGDGAGNFAPWYNATLSGGTPQGRGLAVADFNNDGRPDAAVGNILTGTVEVFLNNAGTTMTPGAILPAFSAFDVTAADFNGDGNLDMAATGYGGSQVFVYFGNGAGGFVAAPMSPYAVGGANAGAIHAEDMNNDGTMDIVVNTQTSLHIFANNGAGVFTQTTMATGYTALYGLFTADLDNDGDVDVVPVGAAANMSIYQNNGAGVLGAVPFPAIGADAANIGDFNGDGRIDIIARNAGLSYFVENTNPIRLRERCHLPHRVLCPTQPLPMVAGRWRMWTTTATLILSAVAVRRLAFYVTPPFKTWSITRSRSAHHL